MFTYRSGRPPLANKCLTTSSLTGFTQRNFVEDFLQSKCDFTRKGPVCIFEPPLGDREATYDLRLKLIEKRVYNLTLSLGVTAEALRVNID